MMPSPAPRRSGGSATIGPSITIKGDVSGDEDLLIQGRIEGKVKVARGRKPDFDIPAGFDIEEHLERPPWEFDRGKEESARILFHSDVAWMVEENRAPGTEFEKRDDGSGVLHLNVRKSDRTHQRLLNYLASYSGQCAVLSPPWLRRQAMAHLRELLERYD